MKITVNGKEVRAMGAWCFRVSKVKVGYGEYSVLVRFFTGRDLTLYEKQCLGEAIEKIINGDGAK